MSQDAERWKNKYFEKMEAAEQKEKGLLEHRHLLERIVVRVSLAADGADRSLDKELGKLRSLLRKEDYTQQDLSRQLDAIEAIVLKMDEQREGVSEAMLRAMTELVDLLADALQARDQRKQLKKYAKSMAQRIDDVREYPALLDEYRKILAQALRQAIEAGGGAERGGFFARLFARGDSDSAAATESSPHSQVDSADPADTGNPDGSEDQDDFEMAGEAAAEAAEDASTETREVDELAAGMGPVEGRVRNILGNLVAQLALPPNMEGAAVAFRERLENSLAGYELVPALEDLATLVISAVGKGQAEFERFLQNLDDRLASIQDFLNRSQSSQAASRANNSALEDQVRTHVTNMQSDMRDAADLDGLKTSVETHLDSIIVSMNEFLHKESEREADINEEMQQLKARIAEMEAESRSMQALLQEEKQRAQTDVLTQLPNRLAFDVKAQEELDRFKRYGRPLTVVVCDIDFFKRINDDYGHLAGDRVLQLIAKEVARRIRTTDFLARFGGEEFVILMPETEAGVAAEVMEKTREMIARLPFHFRNQKVQITMSFGVTQMKEQDDLDSVFERADQALYKAKAEGRNQVQIALDS